MSVIEELHLAAMEAAECALFARRRGMFDAAMKAFREAFIAESRAAKEAIETKVPEPSRSILLRSAAGLALECGENRESERLIAVGLAGDPPEEIADELRDLLEQVHFRRHLDVRGVQLSDEDVQLSVAGSAVGFGFARGEEVISRVSRFQKLTQRTTERLLGRPYRESGNASEEVRKRSDVYLSAARAASFAVSIRLGQIMGQSILAFDKASSSHVLDDVLKGLELVNAGAYLELKTRIGDDAYYRNFIGIARDIFPNGDDVTLVGLTVARPEGERRVQLSRPKRTVQIKNPSAASIQNESIVIGELAAATKFSNTITIEDESGGKHSIEVPMGMLSDIVRPHWEKKVRATVIRQGKKRILQDLVPDEPET